MPAGNTKRRVISGRKADRKVFEDAARFYLDACYRTGKPARAGGFADYLQLARPYLSRRVAQVFGMPLGDFLRARQLERAQQLLRTAAASVTIEQIAIYSAFGSAWTFQRRFKAAFGLTPASYRKQVTD